MTEARRRMTRDAWRARIGRHVVHDNAETSRRIDGSLVDALEYLADTVDADARQVLMGEDDPLDFIVRALNRYGKETLRLRARKDTRTYADRRDYFAARRRGGAS